MGVRCPVAGKFNFTQRGEHPFKTRILGGVTLSPRPDIRCKQNISDFSVCGTDQKEISIDENYCLSVDHLGRPVDIYHDPDYIMKCIGFWKENLRSYLVTYDELDPLSVSHWPIDIIAIETNFSVFLQQKYRCWVYQRADLNRVLISQAVGAFCHIKQDVTSWNFTEGAVVALDMTEYERERDQCPMHFDDGSYPWGQTENYIKIFNWDFVRSSSTNLIVTLGVIGGTCLLSIWALRFP